VGFGFVGYENANPFLLENLQGRATSISNASNPKILSLTTSNPYWNCITKRKWVL